jgi:hypothetical protein
MASPQLRPFKTVLHLSRLLTERTLIKVTVSFWLQYLIKFLACICNKALWIRTELAFAALVLELSMVPKNKSVLWRIPLTTAEGSSTIEDIDMETIGSIEIIKGPNSTSFGSGLGWRYQSVCSRDSHGWIQTKSTTTYGSFGLLKQSFSGNYGEALTKGSVNYNHLQSDGFQNSSYDRKSLTLQGQQR